MTTDFTQNKLARATFGAARTAQSTYTWSPCSFVYQVENFVYHRKISNCSIFRHYFRADNRGR